MLPYDELLEIGRAASALAAELGIACVLQWDETRDRAIRGYAEPGVATPCLIPWRFLFLQEHTRKVYGCPYHRSPLGDLAEESVEDVWNGETAQDMRRSLRRARSPSSAGHNAGCPLVMAAEHRGLERRFEPRMEVSRND